jgi:hypothetical protein
MNHLTLFLGGATSLEATILYNDSQHNILALQCRAKN